MDQVKELKKLASELEKLALADISQVEELTSLEQQFQTFIDDHSQGILKDVAAKIRANVIQDLKSIFPDWTSKELQSAMNLIGPENFEERAGRLVQDIVWFALEKLSR